MSSRRVIVAGGGRVGYRTARLLKDRGDTVVVVESDPDRCEAIAEQDIATVIQGDASRPGILRQADPGSAHAVAALTQRNGTNMAEGAPAAGRSLEEVSLPQGSLIVSDRDGSRVASHDTVLEAGRRYIVAVETDVYDEVLNLFRS